MARSHISAHYRGKVVTVPVEDITHFTSGDKYITAHHQGGELLLYDTLDGLGAEFPNFVRIHRTTLVRRALITELVTGEASDGGYVKCLGLPDLRVSKLRTKTVKALLAA